MKALVRFSIVAIIFAAMQSTATADPIDLTKGLGQFTWGMKRDVLLKKAEAAYGAANVTVDREYTDGYPGDAVIIHQGPVKTRFSFSQDQFIAFTRTIDAKIGGYTTSEELEKAQLEKRAKELFIVPDFVTLTTHAQSTVSAEYRVTDVSVTVSAKNVTLEDDIRNELRVKAPSLIETVIEPLGKP